MATAAKTTAGFKLPCPKCGASDGDLVVRLDDVTVVCRSCDETITRADLCEMAETAARLVRWLDAADSA